MGKTGRWIRNFLTGKKDKDNSPDHSSADHRLTTPKEKRRLSFRRSSVAAPQGRLTHDAIPTDDLKKQHALALAAATAAAADAAAKAATAVIQLTAANEEIAAVRIQSVFRAHLARKALNALKGLVKLQALVRGHLVRLQAAATLRCMHALVAVQARARAQRLRLAAEETKLIDPSSHRKSIQENRFTNSNQDYEENIKIVEMDSGVYKSAVPTPRNSYSSHRNSTHNEHRLISPAPSAITEMGQRACRNQYEEYYSSFGTAQSSPQCCSSALSKPDHQVKELPFSYPRSEYAESLYNDYPFYPNYMANTESSRAKVRSHSEPKQRPVETFGRQPSRLPGRTSLEGRNVPRAVRMQRSSSQVGSTAQNNPYPWSAVKLDRSAVSLHDSECGSTCTVKIKTNNRNEQEEKKQKTGREETVLYIACKT